MAQPLAAVAEASERCWEHRPVGTQACQLPTHRAAPPREGGRQSPGFGVPKPGSPGSTSKLGVSAAPVLQMEPQLALCPHLLGPGASPPGPEWGARTACRGATSSPGLPAARICFVWWCSLGRPVHGFLTRVCCSETEQGDPLRARLGEEWGQDWWGKVGGILVGSQWPQQKDA